MAHILKKEHVNLIPEFNGEPELLARFLEITTKLINRFADRANPDNFQNEYLISSILAKIKGPAATIVHNSTFTTFEDLKSVLTNAYADKRDSYTLNTELTALKQNNDTPIDFYNKIQKILNLMLCYFKNKHTVAEATILSNYARGLALRTLLKGLNEPLSSILKAKNPTDLNSALNMITNDFQYNYAHNTFLKKTFHKPNYHSSKTPPRPQYQNRNFMQNTNKKPTFQYQQRPQQFLQQQQRPQQFLHQQQQQLPAPTPMSISTQNTMQPTMRQKFNQITQQENPTESPQYFLDQTTKPTLQP